MSQMLFNREQLAFLEEIKAPYDPDMDYLADYLKHDDFEESAVDKLLEYVRDREIYYAQEPYDRERARAARGLADYIADYCERLFSIKETHDVVEAVGS
jgi:hypothetical protein